MAKEGLAILSILAPYLSNLIVPFCLLSTIAYVIFEKIDILGKKHKYASFVLVGFIIWILVLSIQQPSYLFMILVVYPFFRKTIISEILRILKRHRKQNIAADFIVTFSIVVKKRYANLVLGVFTGLLFLITESIMGFTLRVIPLVGIQVIVMAILVVFDREIITTIKRLRMRQIALWAVCALGSVATIWLLSKIFEAEVEIAYIILLIVLWGLTILVVSRQPRGKHLSKTIAISIIFLIGVFSPIGMHIHRKTVVEENRRLYSDTYVALFGDSLFHEFVKMKFNTLKQIISEGRGRGTDTVRRVIMEWELVPLGDSTVKLQTKYRYSNGTVREMESEHFIYRWMVPPEEKDRN